MPITYRFWEKYQEKPPLPFIPGFDYSGVVEAIGSQVLLVLGAVGGVGLAAVQTGKVRGAIIIAVARGDEKVQLLKSLGMDHVIDLSKGSIIESVREFLKLRNLEGVDVLYDPVRGMLLKESLKLLKWVANILVIGFASREIPVIPANIALVKELLSWVARGLITIHMFHIYTLSEVNLAFSAIKERKVVGKVMIVIDDNKTVRLKL
ncbi:hypothetical protein NE237_009680 [Protea cynaroides]|uniref:Alcohol dehydrogenase-like C-terminal domain-containing protein n=1 Tax=Protea cynaroides TaxID=273540 RepID=A0A9Q0R0Z2_9MAGN|nr:hypothetical protein NE237_009680 [Protea cynaroides]